MYNGTKILRLQRWRIGSVLAMVVSFHTAHAGGVVTLDPVTVEADAVDLIGTADAASVGTITPEQLRARPVFRPGELLRAFVN